MKRTSLELCVMRVFYFECNTVLFGTAYSHQPIVGVPDKRKFLVRLRMAREFLDFLLQLLKPGQTRLPFFRGFGVVDPIGFLFHLRTDGVIYGAELFAFCSRFIKSGFYFLKLLIQLIQIDICQNGRTDAALRRPAVRSVVFPILYVSGFQKLSDDVQEFAVFNFPAQYGQ